MKKVDLYIDLEWFPNQELYLIGYAYSISENGLLYDETLTIENIVNMLQAVTGSIFFYGPDIGMLEKSTGLDIRNNFRCVNLLKLFRKIMPGLDSYKLSHIEQLFGIERSTREYKANIWKLVQDWKNPYKKQKVLQYNREDTVNLVRLVKIIFPLYGIDDDFLYTAVIS